MVQDFGTLKGIVPEERLLMVAYNLTKYEVLLLKRFNQSFSSTVFKKRHPQQKDLAWKALFTHPDFTEDRKSFIMKLKEAEERFEGLHQRCRHYLKEIGELNEYF